MGMKGILAAIMGLTLSGLNTHNDVFGSPVKLNKPRTKRTRHQGERSQPKRRKWLRSNPHMRRYQ